MNLFITIDGLDALQGRADASLIEEPTKDLIQQLGSDLATPRGSGIGVLRNSLGLSLEDMAATITTSTVWPRTAGTSWEAATQQDFADEIDQMLEGMAQTIQQGWEG